MFKTLVPLSAALLFAACGNDSSASPKPEGGAAASPKIVRLSAIPDFNKGTLEDTCKHLCAYLKSETGVEFRYDASPDYAASVSQMVANKLDLVWYGGVTSCDAETANDGNVTFVACRDIDQKFKSYFIANKDALAAGKLKPIENLTDLKALAKDVTFTFGDKKSTSGHIMPRHFLVTAGIDPEKDFKSPANYRPSGSHAATLASVGSGEVDLGALNYSYYDKAKPEDQAKAPIVFTTPTYVDYCFVAHNRLGKDLIEKIRNALLKLDANNPEQAAILKEWGAGRFVAADSVSWDGIRSVIKSLPKDFLK